MSRKAHPHAQHSRLLVAMTAGAVIAFGGAPGALAQEDDAGTIVKAMSAYLASQKTISLSFDSSLEAITPDLQKIQFNSSGKVLLSRPDKLRVSRVGGYADVDLVFDGKTLTVDDKNTNRFAQEASAASIDELVEKLREEHGVEAPGADLLVSDVYKELMAGVINAKHVGRGVIDGVECEHLAFRNEDTDWQIWIEAGKKPIPRKYVITSKAVAGAPQYTLRVSDWKTDVAPETDAFVFKTPADAKKVSFRDLADADELPPGKPLGDGARLPSAEGEKR